MIAARADADEPNMGLSAWTGDLCVKPGWSAQRPPPRSTGERFGAGPQAVAVIRLHRPGWQVRAIHQVECGSEPLRLPLAALLVAWGARTDRRWVLPVGICLALPTIWLNSPTILVALLPLAAAGAATPAGAWLRGARGPVAGSLRPLPPPRPRGTVPQGEEEPATIKGAEADGHG